MRKRLSSRPFVHVLAGIALALVLVAGLSLLFSHLEVRAKPATELAVTNGVAAPTVLTPTSQTRSPEKGKLITREGVFPVQGVAWLGDNRPPFPGDPTLLPIVNAGEANYVVDWTEAVSGTDYVLYEADDKYFEDQTVRYSGDETDTFISGQPEGTYYYRVKSYNAAGPSRWSNVETVTVGAGMASSAESKDLSVAQAITVWVRVDAGAWHTAPVTETTWGGWDWSYDWSLPEKERYQEHSIQTRASAEGAPGPTDTITVTVNNLVYRAYLPLIVKRWPPIPYAPELLPIDNPESRVSYTVDWTYDDDNPDVPDPTSYTLQEAPEPDFEDPVVYTTSATEYAITDPFQQKEAGAYYYRVRGHNVYGPGEWSEVSATTVRLVPHAPTLHDIDNADGDDSYTVDWSYGYSYPTVDTFIVQEATNVAFTGAVEYSIGGATTLQDFSGKGSKTYYYRVKGRNAYGDGPWSEVKSVISVSADFFDSFNDPESGWTTHNAWCCLSGCDDGTKQQHPQYKYSLFYEGGKYHVKIPLDCRAVGGEHGDTRHIYPVTFAPGVERPTTKTCIELKGGFENWDPMWSFWGLVFAASDDKGTVYSLEVNNLGDWAVLKRTGYDFPGPNAPWQNETRRELVDEGWTGAKKWPAREAFNGNTLRAEVNGDRVKLFINGTLIGQYNDSDIGSLRRVGIIGGDWEITPTQIGYEYFYVDKGCDDF